MGIVSVVSKRRWRIHLLAIAVCVVASSFGNAEDAPLVIASEGARPPFNFLEANNELAGFEIDLGRELCQRLQRSCSFVVQDWDGLLPGLLARQYDAVLAALDITDERRAKVAFSIPYVRLPAAFVVAKTSALTDASVSALKDKTIGVEEGSPSQSVLEESYKDTTTKSFASLEEAMLDLAEGKLDAVLADKLAIRDFMKTRREGHCCRILADAPRDPAIFGEGVGVALRKNDVALRQAIDAALQAMFDDGTFAMISGKYFDVAIR